MLEEEKFQPTRPLRGATGSSAGKSRLRMEFQPTRPLRGATEVRRGAVTNYFISTHAPLAGRDCIALTPCRQARYFNPRAPCGARLGQEAGLPKPTVISTHAPLAGRDEGQEVLTMEQSISTHAPLAGRDNRQKTVKTERAIFQPTRPLRGATSPASCTPLHRADFNPRAPCGARHTHSRTSWRRREISTHAPLAGRDACAIDLTPAYRHFNPRAPCGARRRSRTASATTGRISTHAPLAGRDMTTQRQKNHGQTNFNPRAPCGARPFAPSGINSGIRFQPTRPLRGATAWEAVDMASDGISTHAPLAGRDEMVQDTPVEGVISTHAPLAGRDGAADRSARGERISTHAPLAGRDRPAKLHQSRRGISTHAPLAGRDLSGVRFGHRFYISTHAPLAGRDFCNQNERHHTRISTHAPLAGRDEHDRCVYMAEVVFQPTRPLRGATKSPSKIRNLCNISTHAPLAGRDDGEFEEIDILKDFNPRAPCGARQIYGHLSRTEQEFQPTRPLRGATMAGWCNGSTSRSISTHAPLAGRDKLTDLGQQSSNSNFNPRAPCGARL